MELDRIPLNDNRFKAFSVLTCRHARHSHIRSRLWSRRQILHTVAGASALGLTLNTGFLGPTPAEAKPGIGNVLPIPGGLELFGEPFHIWGPPLTGVDSDPASVNNFQGTAGIAFVSDEVTRTNRKTGEAVTLPALFHDMRFMQGVYRGRDGHVRDGTFAFV